MPPMTPFLTIPPVLGEDCAAKKGTLNPYEHTGHESIFYTALLGGYGQYHDWRRSVAESREQGQNA